jgi:hypothetical protein
MLDGGRVAPGELVAGSNSIGMGVCVGEVHMHGPVIGGVYLCVSE